MIVVQVQVRARLRERERIDHEADRQREFLRPAGQDADLAAVSPRRRRRWNVIRDPELPQTGCGKRRLLCLLQQQRNNLGLPLRRDLDAADATDVEVFSGNLAAARPGQVAHGDGEFRRRQRQDRKRDGAVLAGAIACGKSGAAVSLGRGKVGTDDEVGRLGKDREAPRLLLRGGSERRGEFRLIPPSARYV